VTSGSVALVPYDHALRSGDPAAKVKAHALAAVVALVPATVAVFAGVTRRLVVSEAVALQTAVSGASIVREWDRYLAETYSVDPFGPQSPAACDATVLTLDDVAGGEPTGRFAAYLQRVGVGDGATLYLRAAGTIVGLIGLVRTTDQPRFTRAEAVALRRIHPLVEHAYLCAAQPEAESTHDQLRAGGLTAREVDVAELVGRGAANADIARCLNVSHATVKTHLTRIYSKLGVRTRTQLAIRVGAYADGGARTA
jgi:DNA-binding CsgD family transcriptional regulator